MLVADQELHKEKQILVFAMALVLAWLLISCVAWCTLCTSLTILNLSLLICKMWISTHQSPLRSPTTGVKWDKAGWEEQTHKAGSLSDSPKQGHLPHFQKYGQCYQLTAVVKQKQVSEVHVGP